MTNRKPPFRFVDDDSRSSRRRLRSWSRKLGLYSSRRTTRVAKIGVQDSDASQQSPRYRGALLAS
ncbi:hypothetical protein, partial [Haloarchaeobius iranensis]|uniref:hypothetical protein n=1 Tax=Haloarchaeobius iranensis TaxID=996166 RepID=UPI001C31A2BF